MPDRAITVKKLGRYDITRVLGKGAMGVVYEARDPNLNRKVAIKTVRVDSLSKDDAIEYELRFRTEAHSAARLQHPNIVSVYDSDRDGSTPFLVMEFVKGEDLKHYLDAGHRYTLEQSVRMMRDLLSALDYAHQHKIIHRDIKPANMLIEADGRLKLTDFGVARIQDSGEATRTQGGMVGTLKYMSPEQLEGKSVDAASDTFSAGIVLYQLLTDRRPFDGDSYFSIVSQIANQEPPGPSSINPMLPPALDAVVARALAKDKTQRFATAQDFALALQAAARSADPTITPNANPYKIIEQHNTWSLRSGSTASSSMSNTGSTVTQEIELVYWKDVKESDDAQDLEGFLSRFPEGVYADLAKRRLKRIADTNAAQGQALYDSTQIVPQTTQEHIDLSDDTTAPIKAKPQPDAAVAPQVPVVLTTADTTVDTVTIPPKPGTSVSLANTPASVASTSVSTSASNDFTVILPAATPPAVAEANPPASAPPPVPVAVTVTATATVKEAETEASVDDQVAPPDAMTPKAPRKTRLLAGAAAVLLALGASWAWIVSGSDQPATTSATTSVIAPVASTVPPASSPMLAASHATASSPAQYSSGPAATSVATPPPGVAPDTSAATAQASSSAVAKITPKQAASAAAARAALRAQAARETVSRPTSTHTTGGAYTNSAPRAPEPSPQQATTSPVTPAAVSRARDSVATGPKEACEGRILLGYMACLGEQCARSVFHNHPICTERRAQEEQRKAAEFNR
jgi:eukaryotic-like serine/threonine-protein kinase